MSWLLFLLLVSSAGCGQRSSIDKENAVLSVCQACRTFVKSFNKAMDLTSRGKHEGGDADWESRKLKKYSDSEIRLADIHGLLCTDVKVGTHQCHHLAGEVDELVEDEWWSQTDPRPDLFQWLCVEKRSVCCPPHHFGPQCLLCPGGQPPCSGHGRCKGAGTRKGNGLCSCDEGYEGEVCDACNSTSHFKADGPEGVVLCERCHSSCDGPCTGAGPKLCVRCGEGYWRHSEEGCVDLDECRPTAPNPSAPCRKDQFCVNNVGSFSCLECDKSCASCHGDGPDMCLTCAENHTKQDGVCVDVVRAGRALHVTVARYLTYVGLAVAALILTQKSARLASLVAACVAIYIAVAEVQVNQLFTGN